ncbi:solute carrier family 31 (copper transporter), member 1 [Sporothrix schenckii 1099-18]|uniref:Copper transport protein n=1 Tax=Sporothrix schenckii 1099-18 TaxID=1397361 RepID=A0A0F2M7R2_SPOSC|nr:solute carrier family 31 (copper transporter), member 1 [Sporothrix schenckii 1099-18]KJR84865.1 solute carrier family 31 (copper transporter), member 1 [Sporothrix schenckii 1099-18]
MDHTHHHMAEGADMTMDRCTMNMLFTWDTNNLCIVFRWWHIRTTPGLILSLLAVVALGAGYEALREGIRRYEMVLAKRAEAVPPVSAEQPNKEDRESHGDRDDNDTETTPFLRTGQAQVDVNKRAHVTKAVLYGIQNFYAFMIMLVFMTYNGWVMLSVSIGAFVGYLLFGGATPVVKETACH